MTGRADRPESGGRDTGVMVVHPGAQNHLPDTRDIVSLATAVAGCRGCDLYRAAEPAVFGAGPTSARILLVGDQPGDDDLDAESWAGFAEPFAGHAGRLLDDALAAAGIDRHDVYRTTAVKHVRFDRAGRRRIRKKPSGSQITACRPWLLAELAVVRPRVVVCLGATAAHSLLGADVRVAGRRGTILRLPEWLHVAGDPAVIVTIHPSAVLRAWTNQDDAFDSLVRDLRRAVG